MASRRQLNNVIFLGYISQVLENRMRVSYAYSVFWRLRAYSDAFYFDIRVFPHFDT